MTRFRNPTTATIDVIKALTLCKTLYNAVENSPVTSEAIAKAIGYVNLNGIVGSLLASLKQYGLLIPINEYIQRASNAEYKLSEIALIAIKQDTPSIQVAKQIILTPSLYQKLFNTFQENLPSEDNKIAEVIVNEGFSEDKAQDLVRIVKKNWELLLPPTRKIEPINKSLDSTVIEKEKKLPIFKLLKDCEATVSFSSTITNEAIDKLIKHLELYKDVYPSISEIRRHY